MKFQIGDMVREGWHVGTVTDVGTVLVQVKTDEGTSRVVCPWELVRIRVPHDGDGVPLATGATASNDSANSCGVMFMDSTLSAAQPDVVDRSIDDAIYVSVGMSQRL